MYAPDAHIYTVYCIYILILRNKYWNVINIIITCSLKMRFEMLKSPWTRPAGWTKCKSKSACNRLSIIVLKNKLYTSEEPFKAIYPSSAVQVCCVDKVHPRLVYYVTNDMYIIYKTWHYSLFHWQNRWFSTVIQWIRCEQNTDCSI